MIARPELQQAHSLCWVRTADRLAARSCFCCASAHPLRSRTRLRWAAEAAGAQGGGLSYRDAGVDIDAGNELVRRIQKLNPSIGGFSGMVPFGAPLLKVFLKSWLTCHATHTLSRYWQF